MKEHREKNKWIRTGHKSGTVGRGPWEIMSELAFRNNTNCINLEVPIEFNAQKLKQYDLHNQYQCSIIGETNKNTLTTH